MKPSAINAAVLFESQKSRLKWDWVAGKTAIERVFSDVVVHKARSSADLVGYLNYIHPYRAQVLGERELAYLNMGGEEDSVRRINRILELEPPLLVVADGYAVLPELVALCERGNIPLFVTQESAAFVIEVLRTYLSKHFADRISRHGVMLDIFGVGTLITGESGLGKSELALELVSRGHGFVADDSVDILRTSQVNIEGRCPALSEGFLELRGIGLLDIRAIFGETAMRRKMPIKLVVHLVRRETMEREYERIPYEPLMEEILGIAIHKVVIQVEAGRNMAVLVEAAVRSTVLHLRGINTMQVFMERQRKAMLGD